MVPEGWVASAGAQVKVLEGALDDVSTSLEKKCAILRMQATSFVQASTSAHALAVEKV